MLFNSYYSYERKLSFLSYLKQGGSEEVELSQRSGHDESLHNVRGQKVFVEHWQVHIVALNCCSGAQCTNVHSGK